MGVREVTILPGVPRPYVGEEWTGALVVVARGVLALECRTGGRRRFGTGETLWLDGLPLRALHAGATRDALLRLRVLSPPGAPTAPSTRPPWSPAP